MATPPIVSPFPRITPKRYQRERSIVQSKARFFVVPRSRLTAWVSESKSKDLSSVFLFSFSFSRSLLRRNGGFSSSKEPEARAEDEIVMKGGSSIEVRVAEGAATSNAWSSIRHEVITTWARNYDWQG